MMKRKILPILLVPFLYTSCYRTSPEDDPKSIVTNIEKSKNILALHVEQLDSSLTSLEIKKRIICKDYPDEYKLRYIPNMMKLNSIKHIESNLLKEMDEILDYYKQREQIQC